MMRATTTLVTLLLLSGCSSYQVTKLDANGTIPAKASGGIPVTLGRPQFVVKRVEGADPEQYQVSVTYVPDPDQRYAVRIGSTPLANANLSLAFSDGGALSSSTAAVKDQAAPTTLALFKVAASIVGATGPAGFMSADEAKKLSDCFPADSAASQGARIRCVLTLLAAEPGGRCRDVATAPDGLLDRLAPFITRDQKDRGVPANSLFARDLKEHDCLEEAKQKVSALIDVDDAFRAASLSSAMTQAIADASEPTTPGGLTAAVRDAIAEALPPAIARGDVDTLKRWFYVTNDDVLTQEALQRLIPASARPKVSDARIVKSLLASQKLEPHQDGFERVRRIGEAILLAASFEGAAELEPAPWRGRYIAWLQRRADEVERDALVKSPSADVRADAGVRAIREKVAALAGVRAEYDRWLAFQAQLKTLPSTPSADQRLSPAGEYEDVRAQAAALEQSIAAAIAARLTGEPANKAERTPPTSPWMSASCVERSRDEGWRYRLGADASLFAVVLRRVDGTPIAPSKGALRCDD